MREIVGVIKYYSIVTGNGNVSRQGAGGAAVSDLQRSDFDSCTANIDRRGATSIPLISAAGID